MAKTTGAKTTGAPAETHNAPHAAGGAAPAGSHGPSKGASPAGKGKAGPGPMPGGCLSWGCKVNATRFNFCDEHFDHFKFGLIKKTGEPVPDYEKKYEHFVAYRAKQGHKKVA